MPVLFVIYFVRFPGVRLVVDTSAAKKIGPKPPPRKSPPEGAAVLMTCTPLKKGMIVGPKRALKYAGQEYTGGKLLAAIAKEDGVSGQTAVNTR